MEFLKIVFIPSSEYFFKNQDTMHTFEIFIFKNTELWQHSHMATQAAAKWELCPQTGTHSAQPREHRPHLSLWRPRGHFSDWALCLAAAGV